MAGLGRRVRALVVVALAAAQMGMDGGPGGMGMGSGRRQRDKEPLADKADLACIKCDVCEIVASELWRAAASQRAAAPMTTLKSRPGQAARRASTFSEDDVNTLVTAVCNRRKEAGEWLWHVDLVETASLDGEGSAWRPLSKREKASSRNFLQVYRTQRGGQIRKWDRESATVKRSCDLLLDEDVGDVEDLVISLWKGDGDEKGFKSLVCRELSARCKGDRKPVNAGRVDLPFDGQDKTLMDTERMMENMADQGMPMVMQSREDMMEELYEQMEAEGLSREDADAFIEAAKQPGAADALDAAAGVDVDDLGTGLNAAGAAEL